MPFSISDRFCVFFLIFKFEHDLIDYYQMFAIWNSFFTISFHWLWILCSLISWLICFCKCWYSSDRYLFGYRSRLCLSFFLLHSEMIFLCLFRCLCLLSNLSFYHNKYQLSFMFFHLIMLNSFLCFWKTLIYFFISSCLNWKMILYFENINSFWFLSNVTIFISGNQQNPFHLFS